MMSNNFPTREEAKKIWEAGIQYRIQKPYGFIFEDEYRSHTIGVAEAAEAIAKHIDGMDSNKAYVMGLLHDYGKRINQNKEDKFHGIDGYEQMLEMGYPEVARICITHTFPQKDFNEQQYTFSQEWKDQSRKIISNIEYDDYDYLIALCDKMFEGLHKVSIKERVEKIGKRYNLGSLQTEILYNQSIELKQYFDNKANQDIYEILDIKE